MKKWLPVFAVALASCSANENSNVSRMLKNSDPEVCAVTPVQVLALSAIYDGYKTYIEAGGKPISLTTISATAIDKDTKSVSCSAVAEFPSTDSNQNSISTSRISISYTVRPSLGKDEVFNVTTNSLDFTIEQKIRQYILVDGSPAPENPAAFQQPYQNQDTSSSSNISSSDVPDYSELELYRTYRERLISSGFSPVPQQRSPDESYCGTEYLDPGEPDLCVIHPEVESCAGSGMRPCLFVFRRNSDGRILTVSSVGELNEHIKVDSTSWR